MRSRSFPSARRAFHRRQAVAALGWLAAFALAVFVVAQFFRPPLPEDIFIEARALRDKLAAVHTAMQGHRVEFDRHANGSRAVGDVVAAEQLRPRMSAASEAYAGAVALFNGEIARLLTINVLDDLPRLAALIDHAGAVAEDAERLSAALAARARVLAEADADRRMVLTETLAVAPEVARIAAGLAEPVRAAQLAFPHKQADLAQRLARVDSCPPPAARPERAPAPDGAPPFPPAPPPEPACRGNAADGHALLAGEAEAPLARLADRVAEMRARLHHAGLRRADILERTADLPRIRVVRLTDMAMRCYASFTVYTWNKGLDGEGTHYPLSRREVPCDAWVALNALGEDEAVGGTGWAKVPLSRLGIGEPRIPEGHNHNVAEVHVNELDAQYRHQLTTFQDGATRAEWVEVDEDTFVERQNDLGMDIRVKPAGLYEDEALDEPSPPGLALVGEPETGYWENRGAARVWVWRPLLDPFMSPAFVNGTRHAWDEAEWRLWTEKYRGRAPYYGRRQEEEERSSGGAGSAGGGSGGRRSGGGWGYDWGSEGSKTRDTAGYKDSTYKKTNVPRLPEDSVRGAGESSRGGGPGGGGK